MEKDTSCEAAIAISQETNESSPEEMNIPSSESHSFAISSNIASELTGGEQQQFYVAESMASDGEDNESPLKSFFCVDYLEIMHDEMLNPESSNHVSEPDTPEEVDFVCKQLECDFSTTDIDAYLKHEYEHIDGKSYECDICHVKFHVFANMRSHRMSHLSHRPYKCRLCSKEFFRKDVLVEHLVKQHSKQRPYRCPFCPRHFKLRAQLKLHLSNEHSAARLIKTCKLCGFKSNTPSAFRNHFAICYTKRSSETPVPNGSSLSQVHVVSSEANAIDLGAVSQNFSFVPSHFAPYAIVTADGAHSLPGPSDINKVVPLHTTSVGCSIPNKNDHCTAEHQEAATSPQIRSLASSTTAVSPTHTSDDEAPQNLVMTNIRAFVKSEPAEVRADDSQNGSALPTSTMDLSATNVVETSFNSSEAVCCQTSPDLPIKVTAACSSRERRLKSTGVETSKEAILASRSRCSVARESLCRCTSTGSRHSHYLSSRDRAPDENLEQDNQQRELLRSRKRMCQDKSTSTDILPKIYLQNDIPSSNQSDQLNIYPRTPLHSSDCCTENKNHLSVNKEKDNSSHICPFCEIVFPDQTLYFLHRSLHSETHPWKCNLCGKVFKDKYDFNSHIISQGHH